MRRLYSYNFFRSLSQTLPHHLRSHPLLALVLTQPSPPLPHPPIHIPSPLHILHRSACVHAPTTKFGHSSKTIKANNRATRPTRFIAAPISQLRIQTPPFPRLASPVCRSTTKSSPFLLHTEQNNRTFFFLIAFSEIEIPVTSAQSPAIESKSWLRLAHKVSSSSHAPSLPITPPPPSAQHAWTCSGRCLREDAVCNKVLFTIGPPPSP